MPNMRKSEFETKLLVGIAYKRLALLSELENRNLFYSSQMYSPDDKRKVYLLELREDYFILRYDLIFDRSVERFFYVSKESFEYIEENLKNALFILQKTERMIYEILSNLKLRGFYSKNDFIRSLLQILPQLEWVGNHIRDRKSATVFITVREDILHFTYKEGNSSSYMDIAKKDLNEKVLMQCVELIRSALEYVKS